MIIFRDNRDEPRSGCARTPKAGGLSRVSDKHDKPLVTSVTGGSVTTVTSTRLEGGIWQ